MELPTLAFTYNWSKTQVVSFQLMMTKITDEKQ